MICVVGWQGLTPGDCQTCGGLFEMGISVVADHIYNGKRDMYNGKRDIYIYNGKRDALCCYG